MQSQQHNPIITKQLYVKEKAVSIKGKRSAVEHVCAVLNIFETLVSYLKMAIHTIQNLLTIPQNTFTEPQNTFTEDYKATVTAATKLLKDIAREAQIPISDVYGSEYAGNISQLPSDTIQTGIFVIEEEIRKKKELLVIYQQRLAEEICPYSIGEHYKDPQGRIWEITGIFYKKHPTSPYTIYGVRSNGMKNENPKKLRINTTWELC